MEKNWNPGQTEDPDERNFKIKVAFLKANNQNKWLKNGIQSKPLQIFGLFKF